MTHPVSRLAAAALAALTLAGTAAAATPAADHPAVRQALSQLRARAEARLATGDDFAPRDLVTDADGTRHVRFLRTHQGLRVIGGDLVVHLDARGQWRGVSHAMKAAVAVSLVPGIDRAAIERRAKALFDGTPEPEGTHAELVVYARDRAPVLAWDTRVTGIDAQGQARRLHRLLDAHTGALLDEWDEIQTVDALGDGISLYSGTVPLHANLANGVYKLVDRTRGNHAVYDLQNRNGQFTTAKGTLYTDDDNHWGDGVRSRTATSDAVDAAYGQNMTWDFYRNTFGRNGIADDGRGAYSRVHSKTGLLWYNAFWDDNCFCMTYTSGLNGTDSPALISLDVAGHEMTHGVTSNTAGLVYSKESGGLNEATSDIMGTMVEWATNNPQDPPDSTMGERVGTPIRWMYHPSIDGKSADCWYAGVGGLDVHYSSGPANHVFYLMAEGSQPADGQPASPTCVAGDQRQATGHAVLAGIGRDKAQAIWYRALTVYFTSTTDYAAARVATLQAAADLYGGVGSATWQGVADAWSAINVN